MAIVSADDHLDMHTMPTRLWLDRIEPRYRDRAPRVVETPEGKFWEVDGTRLTASGRHRSTLQTMTSPEDDGFRPSTPPLRLKDMDRDGVYCSVIYGPLRFPMKDDLLKAAMLRVLNDWMIGEFNAHAPDRLCALAYLPPHDTQASAEELGRVARMGAKGALLHYFEWTAGKFSPTFVQSWAPLWRAAEETGLPISFHLGGGTHTLMRPPLPTTWVIQGYAACAPAQLDEMLVAMTLSGALESHPRMKIVLGESGIGWIPYIVERMDRCIVSHGKQVTDIRLSQKPSETFSRQVFATFEVDNTGLGNLPFGEDNFMWAADYPHPNGTYPHSREEVARMATKVSPEVARKLTCDNAARLYGIESVPRG